MKTSLQKIALALIIGIFTCSNIQAQNDTENVKGEFWFGTQMITPMGDFRNEIERKLGYGGSIGGLWNPSKKNNFFQIGAEFSLLYMGKDKKAIDYLKVKTTNSLVLIHLIARLRIQTNSSIKPYIDIIGGGKIFSTTTKYNNDVVSSILNIENEDIFGEQTNSAWSYGTGIGFSKLSDNVGWDVKIVYMRGGQTKYIAPENFHQDGNGDFYYENQNIKKTDILSISVSLIGLIN